MKMPLIGSKKNLNLEKEQIPLSKITFNIVDVEILICLVKLYNFFTLTRTKTQGNLGEKGNS
jgi:hypothetical protein